MNRRIKKKLKKRYNIKKYRKYKILNKIKNDIFNMCINNAYDFHNNNLSEQKCVQIINDTPIEMKIETRKPTEHECYRMLLHLLGNLRCYDKITTAQYRSVKGQIRRGYVDIGISFLSKHMGVTKDELYLKYNAYKSKDIIEVVANCKMNIPVSMTSIDISLTRKDNENEIC